MKRSIYLAALWIGLCRAVSGQTELITNGGFESGQTNWVFSGAGAQVLSTATRGVSAYDGTYYLSLGNLLGASQKVYQTVTFPTNLVAATLSFYYDVASLNTYNGNDSLTVYLTDSNQNVVAEFGRLSNLSPTMGYQRAVQQLASYIGQTNRSAYAGQTMDVMFYVTTDSTYGSLTSFGIDDVSLVAGTIADVPANDDFSNRFALPAGSATATATNLYATKEPGEPNHAGNAGGHSVWWSWTAPGLGTVTIDTAGSSFPTLLGVYIGSTVTNLTRVASNNGSYGRNGDAARTSFAVSPGIEYEIAVDGYAGESGDVALSLKFTPDTKAPTITIASPGKNAKLTDSTVVVSGKAADNVAVALVQYRLENARGTNDYQAASGTNTWSATITDLSPGVNTVRVRAVDTSSNLSATVARSFTYIVTYPLVLTLEGSGRVSPDLTGQALAVGSSYRVTAKPGPGYIFAGWSGSGGLASDNPRLTFVMQSNMLLQASFVPNPFLPAVGNYQGLFFDTNAVTPQNSGFFSAKVTRRGSFSAKLLLSGKACPLSGQFAADGTFSNSITRPVALSVQLKLHTAAGFLTGEISNGVWSASLVAERAAYNAKIQPAPQTGAYTLLFPGIAGLAGQPEGDGFGTVKVDASGRLTFRGSLADGTKVSQKTFIYAPGVWPFYQSLYSGQGMILGWLTINQPGVGTNDFGGGVIWMRPAAPGAKWYPGGFTNAIEVIGSKYALHRGVRVLNLDNAQITLSGGDLADDFTNPFVLAMNNKVTGPNQLKLGISSGTGQFKGRVLDTNTDQTISFRGVILQRQNMGGGYFLGTDRSGRVRLR